MGPRTEAFDGTELHGLPHERIGDVIERDTAGVARQRLASRRLDDVLDAV